MYVNPFHKSKYLFIHFKKKLDGFYGWACKKNLCKKPASFKTLTLRINRNKVQAFSALFMVQKYFLLLKRTIIKL
jgi:hypothetical protein